MNTLFKKQLFLVLLISTGLFTAVSAQRDSRRGDSRNNGNSSRNNAYSSQQRGSGSQASPRQNWGTTNRSNRGSSFGSQPSTTNNFPNNTVAQNRSSRFEPNRVNNYSRNNNFSSSSTSRNIVINNTRVSNYSTSRYPQGRYYSQSRYYGYNYAPRRYYYTGAPRYSVLPRGYLSIRFGSYPYYYHSGSFYSYYSGFYEPVFAPIGIHVSILPVGYYPIYLHSRHYYYYDGTYYSPAGTNDYEVVNAPIGAVVSSLPKNATVAVVNGEKFYEFNGTYYKEGVNSRNEVVYTVTGKHGAVNNTEAEQPQEQPSPSISGPRAALHVGDVIPVLPDGCKAVVINGEDLLVSPDNTYYKTITADGDTKYKIVGLPASNQ